MAHYGFNKVSTNIRSNQDIELKNKAKTTLIHTDQSKHARSDMVPHLTHQNYTPPHQTQQIIRHEPPTYKLAMLLDPSSALIDMPHITTRHFNTTSSTKSIWDPEFHSAKALKTLLKSGIAARIPKYTTPSKSKYLDGVKILQTLVLIRKYQRTIGWYPDGENKIRTPTNYAKYVFYQIPPKYSDMEMAIFILRTAYPVPPTD